MRFLAAWLSTLPDHRVIDAATLGWVGQRLPAPGTWGTAAGLLLYVAFFHPLDPISQALLGLALLVLAAAVSGEAELRLGRRDPGCIIVDELVATPLCFFGINHYGTPHNLWRLLLAGFVLFRLFDILKPPPLRRLQNLEGGLGIVADDVGAAFASCFLLNLLLMIPATRAWLLL